MNDDVRSLAQGLLTQTQQLAAPVDIQNQIHMDHLTKMVEGIATRLPEQSKQLYWKRLFK